MKRLLTVFMIFLLTAVVGVASATPVEELTDLAQYAPEDAPVFITIRTDDAYFETLDGVVNRVLDATGEAQGIDLNIRELIPQIVQGVLPLPLPGDFDTAIRPWLGDNMAFTVLSTSAVLNDPNNAVVVMLDVADFEAAQAFFEDYYGDVLGEGVILVEQEDGTLFYETQNTTEPSVVLREDVMFVGLNNALASFLTEEPDNLSLAASEEFTTIIDAMPNDEYNIFAYLNSEQIVTELGPLFGMFLADADIDIDFDMLGGALGQQALGFTILEERTLAMDYAVVDDGSEDAPRTLSTDLMDNFPADTALVILDDGLGDTINGLFDLLELFDAFLAEQGVTFGELVDAPELPAVIGPNGLSVFIRQAFEGTTGLDLDETLELLNGTAATYITVDSSGEGVFISNNSIFETDDPELAAEYVEAMSEIIADILLSAEFEDGALFVPPLAGLVTDEMMLSMTEGTVLTSTDEFIIAGSESVVDFALEGDGEAFTDTDSYAYESSLFVENTSAVWYINVAPIRDALLQLAAMDEMTTPEELAQAESLLSLLETSSITTGGDEGFRTARFTLTLGE